MREFDLVIYLTPGLKWWCWTKAAANTYDCIFSGRQGKMLDISLMSTFSGIQQHSNGGKHYRNKSAFWKFRICHIHPQLMDIKVGPRGYLKVVLIFKLNLPSLEFTCNMDDHNWQNRSMCNFQQWCIPALTSCHLTLQKPFNPLPQLLINPCHIKNRDLTSLIKTSNLQSQEVNRALCPWRSWPFSDRDITRSGIVWFQCAPRWPQAFQLRQHPQDAVVACQLQIWNWLGLKGFVRPSLALKTVHWLKVEADISGPSTVN